MWAGISLIDFCTPFPRTTTLQWQHHCGLQLGLAGVLWSGPRATAAPDATERVVFLKLYTFQNTFCGCKHAKV